MQLIATWSGSSICNLVCMPSCVSNGTLPNGVSISMVQQIAKELLIFESAAPGAYRRAHLEAAADLQLSRRAREEAQEIAKRTSLKDLTPSIGTAWFVAVRSGSPLVRGFVFQVAAGADRAGEAVFTTNARRVSRWVAALA